VTQEIEEGETIFSIDRKLLITKKVYYECPFVQEAVGTEYKLVETFPKGFRHEAGKICLSLWLIYHDRLGEVSQYFPYISTLPEEANVIFSNDLKAIFAYLERHVPRLTRDEFLWAYGMIHSRRFKDWEEILIIESFDVLLYPIGDMVNHSDDPTSAAVPWEFVALKRLEEGGNLSLA